MEENYLKRELYERFRRDDALVEFLQSGSLDGLWFWDLEEPTQEWMSPRFWETFGYDPETREHLASEWQDMIHPDDLAVALDNFNKHCADPGHPYDQIVRYRHRDGSTVWIQCRGIVIRDESGTPLRMLGAHTNVTALKEQEEKVREQSRVLAEHAAELERINAELRTFAYSVSHDLRAPLRAISGYSQLLEEGHSEALGEEGLKLLTVVRRNARRMGELITALLSLSRLNQVVLSLEPVDMTRTAVQVFERIPVTSAVNLDISLLPEATVDPILIEQVWQNLLDNAVKYSSEEEAPRISVRGRRQGDELIYTVSDNGAGFDMHYVDRLFAPFQRLHRSSRFAGHGIGLALIQRIILRHGGRVWAEGEPDVGATFSFALPATGASTA